MQSSDNNKPLSLTGPPPTMHDMNLNARALVPYNGMPGDPSRLGPPGLNAAHHHDGSFPGLAPPLASRRRTGHARRGSRRGGGAVPDAGPLQRIFPAQARFAYADFHFFASRRRHRSDHLAGQSVCHPQKSTRPNSALNNERVKKLSIAGESTDWLEKSLKIDYNSGPEIMRISLTGDNGHDIAVLLNAIVDSYLKEIDQQENLRRTGLLEQLTNSRRNFDETLHRKRASCATGPGARHRSAGHRQTALRPHPAPSGSLNKEKREVNAELKKKQSELLQATDRERNLDSDPVAMSKSDKLIRESPLVQDTLKERSVVEKRIIDVIRTSKYGEKDPSLPGLYKDREVHQKRLRRHGQATAARIRQSAAGPGTRDAQKPDDHPDEPDRIAEAATGGGEPGRHEN